MNESMPRRRLLHFVLAAFGLRAFASALAPIPAEDAANYLWMAQRFAAGDAESALSEVFPPLLSLLIAPFLLLPIDPFRAGQLVTAVCGALAVWPLVRLVERTEPGQGLPAAVLATIAPLVVRYGAEVYSEPVFLLAATASMGAALDRRPALAGVLAGVAFWARPEALALGLAPLLISGRRGLVALVPLVGAAIGLAAWRSAAGLPFELLPKLGLHAVRGDGAFDGAQLHVGQFLEHVVALPGIWLEAFQLAGVLALLGLWHARRDPALRPHRLVLLVGILAILLFLPRRRFLISWFFVVLPFAVRGLRSLPERGRWPTLFVAGLTGLFASLKIGETDRIGERQVGEYLGARLEPDETVAGDMTRVLWFAGSRPIPPRHFSVEELVDRAQEPTVRFVVLGARRDGTQQVEQALAPDFTRYVLPEIEQRAAFLRGILVLERAPR